MAAIPDVIVPRRVPKPLTPNQYIYNFDPETIGSAPSNWTESGFTDVSTLTIEAPDDGWSKNQKVLRFQGVGDTGNYAATWDDLDAVEGRETFEIYMRFKWMGSATNFDSAAMGRLVGSPGSGSFVAGSYRDNLYRGVVERDAGSFNEVATSSYTPDTTKVHHIIFSVKENFARFYSWNEGETRPQVPTEAGVVVPTVAGNIGVYLFDDTDFEIDYFAVGLNGDPAPPPEGLTIVQYIPTRTSDITSVWPRRVAYNSLPKNPVLQGKYKNAIFAVDGRGQDLIDHNTTIDSAFSPTATNKGVGLAGANRNDFIDIGHQRQLFSNGLTLIWFGVKTGPWSTGNGRITLIQFGDTAPLELFELFFQGTVTFEWRYAIFNGSGGSRADGPFGGADPPNGFYCAIGTRFDGVQKIVVNGEDLTDNALTPSASPVTAPEQNWAAFGDALGFSGATAQERVNLFAAVLPFNLSKAEALSVSKNPFQIFEPRLQYLPFKDSDIDAVLIQQIDPRWPR